MKLLYRSIELDFRFLFLKINLKEKLYFIAIKYLLLLKNYLLGLEVGKSKIKIFGKKYYYEDRYGIAFLQSVYVDNYFLKKYIKPESIVIDIGANIGQFNFFCHSVLKSKKIYSFEPLKETFKILQLNTNGRNIFNCAISSKNKDVLNMYIPETSLMATLVKDNYKKKEKVSVRKLDSIIEIRNENKIDLLKIDTEGSEYDVTKASEETLKKTKYLLIEASLNRKSIGNLVDILELLKKILPKIKIIELGRVYMFNNIPDSVDVLLKT